MAMPTREARSAFERQLIDTHQRVRPWRDAAIADGWIAEPTYGHEPVERAFTLTRDGFKIMGILRPDTLASLNAWGPDGLAINLPEQYSWDAIAAAIQLCMACGNVSTVVHRVGFAGRVCPVCLPAQQKLHEFPGWTK